MVREMKVTVIFTCFNRKEQSVRCIQRLAQGNPEVQISFIVVDDGSTDGTDVLLAELPYEIQIIRGDGSLFWAGGMRKGIDAYFKRSTGRDECVLLVNDDVVFYDGIIAQLTSKDKDLSAVVVGATCDHQGNLTYGAKRFIVPRTRDVYRTVMPGDNDRCDSFNCNCVLIPSEILKTMGNFDKVYTHSLADLDYGFFLSRSGIPIYTAEKYVGICEKNTIKGTWQDTSLSRWERLKQKESPKGAPFREWFYFMRKNIGFFEAIVYSLSPYVRILLNR